MSLTVVNEPDASRYSLLRDGERIGVAEYSLRGADQIVFTHTEIEEARREKGMAGTLSLRSVAAKTLLRCSSSSMFSINKL